MEEEENDENLEDIHEKGSWLQVNLEIFRYESFSDVGEIRVYFASKILTPCRMH